ncbi:superoxide dismutase [Sphingomonas sp. Leaf407]|uniref:superoxide dismutase n=1 Tax=unclassified Sphingomonas TaxID=196159 RepID=UPI0006FCAE32|nr:MULTISPECIES: superoxide dismutase [unclassified Sphingomonas]KQN37588.1 superoxide dismutase [Sphingomonas sp. Leaf42]KQT27955.1 superoxide dismutase [Sphingomonas sp. Leaf407]
MAFTLPPLPYAYDALEPTIDKETMTLHHDKHHQAYTDKLNEAVSEDASLEGKSIEELLANVGSGSAKLRNNGGGYWNHIFFWETMKGGGSQPSGALKDAIDDQFGGVDALKEQFNAAGVNQFGSGWAWLIVGADGKLAITSTPNQDNPLMDVAAVKGTPILANDVWEHAYYVTYRNARPAYLKAWWDVVDWDKVGERYDAAVK